MREKILLVAITGGDMSFVHVMLNALEMNEKGFDVKVIIEGEATKQISELADLKKPFAKLFAKIKKAGLIDCVCRSCSNSMGSTKSAREQGLTICGDMSGHPPISRYTGKGYKVITF